MYPSNADLHLTRVSESYSMLELYDPITGQWFEHEQHATRDEAYAAMVELDKNYESARWRIVSTEQYD